MNITSITLKNFRNYADVTFRPHPGINILFGENGSGKTNVLEAIHYSALGRSHRTSLDREVVRKGATSAGITVQISKQCERMRVSIQLIPASEKKKHVMIDGKRAQRLSELMGRVQCVIFSPEDLMLIKEGPALRRRYLDMMLSQLSTAYFIALQQYLKALEQRNALLRNAKKGKRYEDAFMEAFETAMAVPSAVIISFRRQMTQRIAALATEKYASISGRPKERLDVSYQCCLNESEGMVERIQQQLKENREVDMERGSTTFGIHHEDLSLTLSGRSMKLYASQGQIRTAALSLKLAQLQLLKELSSESPILLLDDVMSELDMTRRMHLLQEIDGVQTFITCTDRSDLEGCFEGRSYMVQAHEESGASIQPTEADVPSEPQEDIDDTDFLME